MAPDSWIETDPAKELAEISDPLILGAVQMFIHAAYCIEVANWPLSSSGDTTLSRGKPNSTGPGRQHCPDGVKKAVNLARQLHAKWLSIAERGDKTEAITSMGGVSIVIEKPNGPSVGRRKDGTFADGNMSRPGPRLPSLG
jgi:hypothetical protein